MSKLDTRAIGLDVSLSLARWLTGAENLHYGYWEGLEVSAGNLGAAQSAYTDRLFRLLPPGPLRILDIGGGAGETARKLIALGHRVEIVVPSPFLADRCRVNAPQAVVHLSTFEDFAGQGPFDLCLFSESFQYIPMDLALDKALTLVPPGGHVIVSDCFRTPAYRGRESDGAKPGGGHRAEAFRARLAALPVDVLHDEDITAAVAPSIDVEQAMFAVLGHGFTRVRDELRVKKPVLHWLAARALGLVLSARRRENLLRRLTATERTAAVFEHYNRYLMVKLRKR
jgi:SAM-dependent methyltransferase